MGHTPVVRPESDRRVSGVSVHVCPGLASEPEHTITPRHHAVVDADACRQDEHLAPADSLLLTCYRLSLTCGEDEHLAAADCLLLTTYHLLLTCGEDEYLAPAGRDLCDTSLYTGAKPRVSMRHVVRLGVR